MSYIYLCNGKCPACRPIGCYLNGGDCSHTFDEKYAKNSPEERVFSRDSKGNYWEIEKF